MKITKLTFLGQNSGGNGGQANFGGSGGYPPVSTLRETWVLKALFHEGCYCRRASAIWLVMKIK